MSGLLADDIELLAHRSFHRFTSHIMTSTPTWKSLIRFKSGNGIHFGEPDDNLKTATIWKSNDLLDLSQTTDRIDVGEVLSPTIPDTIICIGLNYKEHAAESGVSCRVPD